MTTQASSPSTKIVISVMTTSSMPWKLDIAALTGVAAVWNPKAQGAGSVAQAPLAAIAPNAAAAAIHLPLNIMSCASFRMPARPHWRGAGRQPVRPSARRPRGPYTQPTTVSTLAPLEPWDRPPNFTFSSLNQCDAAECRIADDSNPGGVPPLFRASAD
ncbi:hypothetical protein STHU_51780 [Allostella humosa]|nr:hypothetical protein STHU_51780 [Stella humosa]